MAGKLLLRPPRLLLQWRRTAHSESWPHIKLIPGIRHHIEGKEARVIPAHSYRSWDPKKPVRIRMESNPVDAKGLLPPAYPPRTIMDVLRASAAEFPNREAMITSMRDGPVRRWTYAEYLEEAESVAKAFLALGIGRFGCVGVMMPNCPENFLASVGAIFAGGIGVGLYNTNSARVTSYIAGHAPLKFLILDGAASLERVSAGKAVEDAFPTINKVILLDDIIGKDSHVIGWRDLLDLGRGENNDKLVAAEEAQAANEACMMLYTSGTTGDPKGVLFTHDNLTWTARVCAETYDWRVDQQEKMVSYLPLGHIAATEIDCYIMMTLAGMACFADKDALKGTLVENLKEFRPTRFLGVPRVYDKMREKMMEAAAKNSPIKKKLGAWAKAQATKNLRAARQDPEGHKPTLGYKLAKRLVLDRVHDALGLDVAVRTSTGTSCGSAPLSNETIEYFESLGIDLLNLCGCTESTGPQVTNLPGKGFRLGSIGLPYYGLTNKIFSPDSEGKGEIAASSRNVVMGYAHDEARTKESFTADGWFRTGDVGSMDADGFMYIHGRIKEIIITQGGKNIAPVPIEDDLKRELGTVINNVIVVGEGRKYLTCLLTLKVTVDPNTLLPTQTLDKSAVDWAASLGCKGVATVEDFRAGLHAATLRKGLTAGLEHANANARSHPERVQKFTVLPRDFSMATGELGPTLKLKRYHVYNMYMEDINKMYIE